MRALNGLAYLFGSLMALGEIARFWGDARAFPFALDEMLVAALLFWAASRAPDAAARWHLAGWGAFCGLVVVLLVETAGYQIHGPAKAAGPLYLAILSIMMVAGLWALRRAMGLLVSGIRG